MPKGDVQNTKPSKKFWQLAAFLVLVFLAGGSSRADVPSLQVLRPIAILTGAYALLTMEAQQWWRYRHLIYLLSAVLALTASHLIPLPPGIWQELPGRGVVLRIDQLIGLRDNWRPLSMAPENTANALYSLSIPVAVFALAVQLRYEDHVRLMLLLIGLTIASAAVGLAQAIGLDVKVYSLSSENPGLFANRNHQGVLLALLFPMMVVLADRGDLVLRRRAAIILAGAIGVINLPLIVVTGSRAGLLAALLSIALIPMIKAGRGPKLAQKPLWIILGKYVAGIGVVVGLVWVTVFASRDTALSRLDHTDEDLRYPVWESIVRVLHEYLPWGSGIGSYVEVYQIKEPDALLRPTFSNHAHNELLEIALTAGVPGLILFGWAVVLFAYASWRMFRASGSEGVFGRLGLCMIVVIAFGSAFDYPVRTPIMASVLVIAAVWTCSVKMIRNQDGCR